MRPKSCHKCKWNGKGNDICLKCPGFAEVSYEGQSFVSLDAMEAPSEFLERNQKKQSVYTGGTTELNGEVERSLVVILASFMGMSDTDLLIFRHLYHGENYAEIASAMGVTRESIRKHADKIAQAHPEIMRAVDVMKRKGIGGAKKKDEVEYIQGELFPDYRG